MSGIARGAQMLIGLRANRLLEGDSFRLSVILLIGMAVAQRAVGLIRNVVFCGMLEDHQLGRWSIASYFLGWVAPFVVLGLPGCFGRLSEVYRQQGNLRRLVARTAIISASLALLAVGLHLVVPHRMARLIFNDDAQTSLVLAIGLVLPAVIAMNFLSEFLTSVRLTRAVALMQMISSLTFMLLGTLLLTAWRENELSLIVSFGAGALAATLVGLVYAIPFLRSLPQSPAVASEPEFWKRLVSLAFWIWCANTAANLFDCADQLVLKHFASVPSDVVDSMLGQLFASRIVPILIVVVAGMIAGSLLPYLMKDHESGQHAEIGNRLNAVITLASLGFTALAAVTHLLSPLLFKWLLRGRYDSGLELMPAGFIQYTWFGLCIIANQYLICIDRPKRTIVPLVIGLLSSASLTAFLAPRFGLFGVVWGTMISHGIALSSVLWVTRRAGMHWEGRTLLACLLPLAMILGGPACLAVVAVVGFVGLRKEYLS